jgi:hypothetical protein
MLVMNKHPVLDESDLPFLARMRLHEDGLGDSQAEKHFNGFYGVAKNDGLEKVRAM